MLLSQPRYLCPGHGAGPAQVHPPGRREGRCGLQSWDDLGVLGSGPLLDSRTLEAEKVGRMLAGFPGALPHPYGELRN